MKSDATVSNHKKVAPPLLFLNQADGRVRARDSGSHTLLVSYFKSLSLSRNKCHWEDRSPGQQCVWELKDRNPYSWTRKRW